MKKKIIISAIVLLSGILSVSCSKPSELPPLNEGYATQYVLPDPVDLTQEERDYLESIKQEYNDAISQ